jgi:cytochrome d ubiquinol oxidase subunit II
VELAEVPIVLMLIGLTAYAVLAGADFGAGFWQLVGGRGDRDRALREHAHHAMGPVWEANHVWLIFVLVVCWTAYPTAFGSITSTLAVPFFIAGIGIVLRGTTYALRSGTANLREQRMVEVAFAGSSILTPFALGAVIGGIASARVPVGNAKGDLVTSWLNPTSIMLGVLAVATAAYLAAVYLAADAVRAGRPELERVFRNRALAMAVVAGAAALGGLVVVRHDAHPIWAGLSSGPGLGAVLVSALGGIGTVVFVLRGRYGWARVTAAVAVGAIVAGWGLAQRPQFLPGLTIEEAAAGRPTLLALVVALAIGALVLLPSLGFLFVLVLRGRFDEGSVSRRAAAGPTRVRRIQLLLPLAGVCLIAGVVLTVVVESPWGRIFGVPALLGFVALGFVSLATTMPSPADEVGEARSLPVGRRHEEPNGRP